MMDEQRKAHAISLLHRLVDYALENDHFFGEFTDEDYDDCYEVLADMEKSNDHDS